MTRTRLEHTRSLGRSSGLGPFLLVMGLILIQSVSSASAQLLGRDASDRRIVFYKSGDGSFGFVIDRTGPQTVMRFRGSRENIVLRSAPAARGDMLLRNERGDVVLRLTSFGPATYYPQGDLRGIPVLRTRGQETGANRDAKRAPKIAELRTEAARLAAGVSEALGGSVVFDADWVAMPETGTATLAEAVSNAANALDNLSKEPEERAALGTGLNRVRFEQGGAPGLRREGGTLYVDYTDASGLDGRPSSTSIMSFLREFND